MAKGKGGNKPVATVTLTKNSNTGTTNRTVTPMNGATQAQANRASAASSGTQTRQQAIKSANSLGQGMKIALSNDGMLGSKEIRNLQKTFGAGSLKIDGKLNDLNSRLGADLGYGGYKSNAWNLMNTGRFDTQSDARSRLFGSMADQVLGSGSSSKFGFGSRLNPEFQSLAKGWNATNVPGAGTQFRQGSGQKASGWTKFANTGMTAPVNAGSGTTTNTGTGAGEVLPNDYTPPTDTIAAETTDPIGMMSGGGAGINSAMGIRRKKSSAKQSGASTRGTNQFNRGLSINSFNV